MKHLHNQFLLASAFVGATLIASTSVSNFAFAQAPARVQIDQATPGPAIGPLFYGLMTEEINHSYDGGLYAELIRNRSLKDEANNPLAWTPIQKNGGHVAISVDEHEAIPNSAQDRCLRLDLMNQGQGTNNVGVSNEGFWGVPIVANQTYQVSLWAKASPGARGGLRLALESSDGAQAFGSGAQIPALTGQWKQYQVTLRAGQAPANTLGRFAAYAQGTGTVWMTLVSLMPPTYKNRPNGLRPDLMEKLAALRPTFLRFPGGNYLEGITLQDRFDWKKTLGPLEGRPGHLGTWNYRSSDGLGLLEFLEWCEDLKMEPLLAVHSGFALNGTYIGAGPDLQPYADDALEEIEFVMGGPNTKWGQVRAKLGHPVPFKLTHVEIGNEDYERSGSYDGRYAQIHNAIKAKYPALQLIAAGPVKSVRPDLQDDHYYRDAKAMAMDAGHYDSYSRTAPKIFVGEWATIVGNPTPTLNSALGDAAWLTGLERNADVVVMQCYAPLLVNVNKGAQQWDTNLIGYNAAQSFGSPSYYVQSMFAGYTGDRVLPSKVSMPPGAGAQAPAGAIGVGTWKTQAEYDDLKVTDLSGKVLYSQDFSNGGLTDFNTEGGQWNVQNGALRQSATAENVRARTRIIGATDYDLTLRARKIAGNEGFLVSFHNQGGTDLVWWNLGGWGNSRSAFQRTNTGAEFGNTGTTIETNRWYSIKISVRGDQIQGFLDGKLIAQGTDHSAPDTIFSAVSRDSKSGETFVKLVNFSGAAQRVQVSGLDTRGLVARGQQISGDPEATNSLAEPLKIAPVAVSATVSNNSFSATLPANSASVWRIAAR